MKFAVTLMIAVLMCAESLFAEANVSGLTDIVFKNSEQFRKDVTNVSFKNFSNFHSMRTRLFFDAKPEDNLTIFIQVLINNNTFSLYGAYARIEHLAGTGLNANIGFIPATVGAFGPRTYSDKNPLIGQPLMYIHHSNLYPGRKDTVESVDDFLAQRVNRSRFGLPVIYDACWNTGLELYGSKGNLDYSLGLLAGSVGYTMIEQNKDVPQVTTHLVMHSGPSLSYGVSAWAGPYLFEDALGYEGDSAEVYNYNDYMNTGVATEVQWFGDYLSLVIEAAYTNWQYPDLPDLGLAAGYVEAQYKFTPGWYLAGRYDAWRPSRLSNSQGQKQFWDFPVSRVELGIGYHPFRRMTTKLVTQINSFEGAHDLNTNLYALQWSIGF
jgi:hypothetical protein